jgi:hypothetical protein
MECPAIPEGADNLKSFIYVEGILDPNLNICHFLREKRKENALDNLASRVYILLDF